MEHHERVCDIGAAMVLVGFKVFRKRRPIEFVVVQIDLNHQQEVARQRRLELSLHVWDLECVYLLRQMITGAIVPHMAVTLGTITNKS